MTLFKKACLATIIMSAAASATAATTADLTVTGTITPIACTPSFSGGGAVDYGKISPSSLNRTADTVLAEKVIAYTITCEAPVAVATRWKDSRAGTIGTIKKEADFGLGKSGKAKIGGYTIYHSITNLLGDGKTIRLIGSPDGANWMSKINFAKPGKQLIAFTGAKSFEPSAYKTISGQLKVRAVIGPTAGFDFTNEIKLDGLATMEVVYL